MSLYVNKKKSQYVCIINIYDQIFLHLTKFAHDRLKTQTLKNNNIHNAFCFQTER